MRRDAVPAQEAGADRDPGTNRGLGVRELRRLACLHPHVTPEFIDGVRVGETCLRCGKLVE